MLGLTVPVRALSQSGNWLTGLLLAVLLAVAIRPLLVGVLLWPVRLRRAERVFTVWAGLKGAVPILLGAIIVHSGTAGTSRLYAVIFVVVGFSVTVQGSTMPAMARWLKIPMRTTEIEPWTIGVRLRQEPEGLHRYAVRPGSAADGSSIADLVLPQDAWVSLVIRGGSLIPVEPGTVLQASDEAVVLADDEQASALRDLFTQPAGQRPG